MNVRCTRCGEGNVRNARVIVDEQTTRSSVMRYGVTSSGQPATYYQNVVWQSDLVRNLTADEPRKGINWFTILCIFVIMPYPLLMIVGSCASLSLSNGASTPLQTLSIFAAGVVGLIVLSIVMSVVSKTRTKSFNQKYNDWLDLLGRRYHCGDCGNIMQF